MYRVLSFTRHAGFSLSWQRSLSRLTMCLQATRHTALPQSILPLTLPLGLVQGVLRARGILVRPVIRMLPSRSAAGHSLTGAVKAAHCTCKL